MDPIRRARYFFIGIGIAAILTGTVRLSALAGLARPATGDGTNLVSAPVRIRVPGKSIDTGVKPASVKAGGWETDFGAANYLISSSRLTGSGNVIIYGHNTPGVFGNLLSLMQGDTIVVSDGASREYRYMVIGTAVTEPGDMQLIDRSSTPVLTLYTCIGFLDAQRFVVRALPLDGRVAVR